MDIEPGMHKVEKSLHNGQALVKCVTFIYLSTYLLSNYLLPSLPSFFFLLLKISSFVVYISSFSLYCVLYYIQFHFK